MPSIYIAGPSLRDTSFMNYDEARVALDVYQMLAHDWSLAGWQVALPTDKIEEEAGEWRPTFGEESDSFEELLATQLRAKRDAIHFYDAIANRIRSADLVYSLLVPVTVGPMAESFIASSVGRGQVIFLDPKIEMSRMVFALPRALFVPYQQMRRVNNELLKVAASDPESLAERFKF